MNRITLSILLTCLPVLSLQAADKEQAQVKSSCAALVPTTPAPITLYHDRYFEAFKELVARSTFRVSKEDWNRIQDLDYTKTNCRDAQIWCCESFTKLTPLHSAIPIATHSLPFNALYRKHTTIKSKYKFLFEPLFFETHPGHICIEVNAGLNPMSRTAQLLYHSFTIEKYSDSNTCWWRIYQSYYKAYSLAEWLCIDTPCHTKNTQQIAEIKEYGGGKKLNKQELLNFVLAQTTLLLKGIEVFPDLFKQYRRNMKLTANAYTVHPHFYAEMDEVLAEQAYHARQTTTPAPSLAAELVKQSAQNRLLAIATDSTAKRASKRTHDNDDSTNTDTPPSKRHKPESTDPAPSLAAQPAGVL